MQRVAKPDNQGIAPSHGRPSPAPPGGRMPLIRYCLAVICSLLIVSSASAQIVNGDFENGGTGWHGGSFPTTGGNPNGYGRVESPASGLSGGSYSIDQTFQCGELGGPDSCYFSVDYFIDNLGATPGTGVIKLYVDRVIRFQAPLSDHIPWSTAKF